MPTSVFLVAALLCFTVGSLIYVYRFRGVERFAGTLTLLLIAAGIVTGAIALVSSCVGSFGA